MNTYFPLHSCNKISRIHEIYSTSSADEIGLDNLLFIKSMEVEFEIKSNLPARKRGSRWMTRKIREKIQKEQRWRGRGKLPSLDRGTEGVIM